MTTDSVKQRRYRNGLIDMFTGRLFKTLLFVQFCFPLERECNRQAMVLLGKQYHVGHDSIPVPGTCPLDAIPLATSSGRLNRRSWYEILYLQNML